MNEWMNKWKCSLILYDQYSRKMTVSYYGCYFNKPFLRAAFESSCDFYEVELSLIIKEKRKNDEETGQKRVRDVTRSFNLSETHPPPTPHTIKKNMAGNASPALDRRNYTCVELHFVQKIRKTKFRPIFMDSAQWSILSWFWPDFVTRFRWPSVTWF